ncbi:putative NADPH2 dehydrogenase chain OYE2 [Fusarium austroafricanum]|uniref:Putative NADPH2 dehydrogenase chain OYE2 n=1 Tax=Fusarium austroafricanum TaxID=2364996 RepID=A0A8H4KFG7_9HYPO|nr:putative NADPH2 dehydrogenase chain OYE2 [Fusarium austroafricanum]
MSTESRLWQPLKLGNVTLSHRIALAPLTRLRNDDDHLPLDLMIKYYTDRASTPGTLVISEATGVSKTAEAPNAPGISSPEQIEGWKKIYDAVHAKGSFMFQQLWDLGRAGYPEYLKSRGYKYSSSSNLQLEGKDVAPEALTEEEIWEKIADFRQAARNVIAAGGDGVEIHGAHGYLIDQFISESINNRTDKWGGSVENRARFLLEIIKATVEEIGAEKTALRLSPFATFQSAYTANPWDQFGYIFNELKKAGYKLAYISLVEPRGNPAKLGDGTPIVLASDNVTPFGEREQSLEYFLETWDNQSPVIVGGGYIPDNVYDAVDGSYKKWDVVVAFGRWFISNPDLVYRLKYGVALTPYQRETFYAAKSNKGYNDYAFSQGFLESSKA